MSSERPKRSRKIINYEEDTLHWVEQKELHKALMRSLQEKESPLKNESHNQLGDIHGGLKENPEPEICLKKIENTETSSSTVKILRNPRVAALSPRVLLTSLDSHSSSNESDREDVKRRKKKVKPKTKYTKHRSIVGHNNKAEKKVTNKHEDSCGLRLTRLQSKLLEEAELFKPMINSNKNFLETCESSSAHEMAMCQVTLENIAGALNDSNLQTPRKKLLFNKDGVTESMKNDVESSPSSRLRAQRKFASNASPPQTRSNSPVKMHRQKQTVAWNSTKEKKQKLISTHPELVGFAKSSKTVTQVETKVVRNGNTRSKIRNTRKPKSVFNGVPKTDAFLSYLCFRNTSLKRNLFD
uniref:uncharacterized protein LOC100177519 n=1 Tax=Ciona intestinalis TaxID=7719 RepID=UPI000180CDBE|nr:uncharacterized protein LOC100177519 [Ciona intestinalis]|eukprot:XP_002130388.1 uncharacterized protein LOC100177519 [Ciona intestinalis]